MLPNAPTHQAGPENAPLYFVSAVLKDGRVFVAGGEYNNGKNVDLLAAQIYHPVADHWTNVTTPSNWSKIGDAPSTLLPDGRVLIADITGNNTAIFDPVAERWTPGPSKRSVADEEGWTLLPDGSVLAVTISDAPNAEKYLTAENRWAGASRTPTGHDLVATNTEEIGPAVLMPNGRVFAIGATGHTAIYTPPSNRRDPGEWAAGPDFPEGASHSRLRAPDAPACLLPNGHVLCAVGDTIPSSGGYAGAPTRFFEYNGTTLSEVPHPSSTLRVPTYDCRLLVLPTGEALLSTCTDQLDLYRPKGHPDPTWAPRIKEAPSEVAIGGSYQIKGTQFNGLSQANSYGDDAQMATNYPLARIRHGSSGAMSYLRTHNHSTMAVATGNKIVSTMVSVPEMPIGSGELCIIANGIASHPVQIKVVR
jgi:hypothetical protein